MVVCGVTSKLTMISSDIHNRKTGDQVPMKNMTYSQGLSDSMMSCCTEPAMYHWLCCSVVSTQVVNPTQSKDNALAET